MQLKNKNFSIYSILFLVSMFYLPNTFAQNPTQWGLPEGVIARFGKGPATKTITFSPDGTQFAIGWKTGIWIYDAETYQEAALFTMDGTTEIRTFAFSPDGKTLAGSNLNETRLWDVATGQHKQTFNRGSQETITFSSDGQMLAIGNSLWDTSTGGDLKVLREGMARSWRPSRSFTFSPDGQTFAGTQNYNVFLWDVFTAQLLWRESHKDHANSVVFSPDGETLASGSADNTIRFWDAATGQIKNILTDHRDDVNSVVFTPDGSTLLSGSEDKTIRVWDVATGLQKQVLIGHNASIYSIALSPDGSTLMSGSDDNAIYFWDVAIGERLKILRESVTGVDDIAFSPDNTIIATELGRDILLWDIATGVQKQVLAGHTGRVNSIVFSPNGATLARMVQHLQVGVMTPRSVCGMSLQVRSKKSLQSVVGISVRLPSVQMVVALPVLLGEIFICGMLRQVFAGKRLQGATIVVLPSVQMVVRLPVGVLTPQFVYGMSPQVSRAKHSQDMGVVSIVLPSVRMALYLRAEVVTPRSVYGMLPQGSI